MTLRDAVQGKCPVPYEVIQSVDVALRHLPSQRYVCSIANCIGMLLMEYCIVAS